MNRDDWIGAGVSLGVHLVLLGAFMVITAGRSPAPTLGLVEVEIDTFAEGQAVKKAEKPQPTQAKTSGDASSETSSPEQASPSEESSAQRTAEDESAPTETTSPEEEEPSKEESTPVDLPDQSDAPEGEEAPPEEEKPVDPQEKTIPPEKKKQTGDQENQVAEDASGQEGEAENQREEEETASDQGGESEGSETGAPKGEEGTADDENKAAPFNIEGLNREPIRTPKPAYTEKVNATIRVEITVSPAGRVIRRRLVRKSNPSLELSVLQTLERWRFNPLPQRAPQENQEGIVTFRFRLE